MSILQLFIAPLFIAIPFGLMRPKGQRLLGSVGLYSVYLALGTMLFGSISLANTIILSILYGPRSVIFGEIRIVRGRQFIELSNGDRYDGFRFFLWWLGIFMTLISTGYLAVRIGRWMYSRSRLVQRVLARFAEAIDFKRPAR